MEKLHVGERRRHLRFSPEPEVLDDLLKRGQEALGHVDPGSGENGFKPTLLGLLIDESHAGCCLVIAKTAKDNEKLQPGRTCVLKAGPLHPMKAQVRWRTDLDDQVFKIGFHFLE